MEIGAINPTLPFQANKKQLPQPSIGKDLNKLASVAYDMGQKVFVNESGKEFDLHSNLATLVDNNSGRYARTLAGLRIAAQCLPRVAKQKIKESLDYTGNKLPFDTDKYHFSGYFDEGGTNKVFLLQSLKNEAPSYVMKVNKFSVGLKPLSNSEILKEAQ